MPSPLDYLSLPGNSMASLGVGVQGTHPLVSHALLTLASMLPQSPEIRQLVEAQSAKQHPTLSGLSQVAQTGSMFTGGDEMPAAPRREPIHQWADRVYHPNQEYHPADANWIHTLMTHEPGPWRGSEPITGKEIQAQVQSYYQRNYPTWKPKASEVTDAIKQHTLSEFTKKVNYHAFQKAHSQSVMENFQDAMNGKWPRNEAQASARIEKLYNDNMGALSKAALERNPFIQKMRGPASRDAAETGFRQAATDASQGPEQHVFEPIRQSTDQQIKELFAKLQAATEKHGTTGLPYHLGSPESEQRGMVRGPLGGTIDIGGTKVPWGSNQTRENMIKFEMQPPELSRGPKPKFGEMRKDMEKVDWVWDGKQWLKRPQ